MTSTSPSTPECSATPRPVSPMTPVPCESSTSSDRVVLARELDDVGEAGEVALHREDAVRDDELALAGSQDASPSRSSSIDECL